MTTAALDREHTVLPPADAELLTRVASFVAAHPDRAELAAPDGVTVELPHELYGLLVEVVTALRAGRAITIAPHSTRLTTMEAATLLGVSRPTLVKLLESGQIPFEKPGRHRRIQLVDVLRYREGRRVERGTLLDEITEEAAAAGLYDTPPADVKAAIREARRQARNG